MTYLIDTDVCVDYLRGRSPRLAKRLEDCDPSEVRLSVVTEAELRFGALNSAHPSKSLAILEQFAGALQIVDFDSSCARRYAEARVHLESRGTPIGPNDLLIAATALAHDFTLVTHNTREFGRVLGLRIEDWEH